MATVNFKTTSNRIEGKLNAMITRAQDPRAFLNTTMVNMYANAQIQRWETANASETGTWPALDKDYEAAKKIRFAGFAGAGNAIMVATGKLSNAAILRGGGVKKIVTTRALEISIDDSVIPYAKYAAQKRPFMSFGAQTIEKMQEAIKKYLIKGESHHG